MLEKRKMFERMSKCFSFLSEKKNKVKMEYAVAKNSFKTYVKKQQFFFQFLKNFKIHTL